MSSEKEEVDKITSLLSGGSFTAEIVKEYAPIIEDLKIEGERRLLIILFPDNSTLIKRLKGDKSLKADNIAVGDLNYLTVDNYTVRKCKESPGLTLVCIGTPRPEGSINLYSYTAIKIK